MIVNAKIEKVSLFSGLIFYKNKFSLQLFVQNQPFCVFLHFNI